MIRYLLLIKLWPLTQEFAYPRIFTIHDHLNATGCLKHQNLQGAVGPISTNRIDAFRKEPV